MDPLADWYVPAAMAGRRGGEVGAERAADPRPRRAGLARALALSVVCIATLAGATKLFERDAPFERASSRQIAFRLQSDAFLRGELRLDDSPYGVRLDYAWSGDGVQQLWGLGVPLLRLPFDLIGRACGWPGFPDRFVLAFYIAFATFVFFTGLRAASPRGRWREPEAAMAALLCFCAPSYLALLGTRIGVYEEVVAHLVAWVFLSLGAALHFAARGTPRSLLVAAALAGFTVVIRPTGAFYGAATVCVLLALAHRRGLPRRWLAAAVGLSALGPLGVLAANTSRFGHPLEFGYRTNVSVDLYNDFSLRFGSPYESEPLGSAARELFALLFLDPDLAPSGFYNTGEHAWISATHRFRDLYFPTFDLFVLVALLASLALLLASVLLPSLRSRRAREVSARDERVWLLGMWSALALLPLAIFYLRSPSIASRYLLDFHPAIYGAIVALLLALPRLFRRPWWHVGAPLWALVLLFLVAQGYEHLEAGRDHTSQPLQSLAQIERALARYHDEVSEGGQAPPLDDYVCGEEAPDVREPRVVGNRFGWFLQRGCGVGPTTMLFFEGTRCVALDVVPGVGESFDDVRASANGRMLERRPDVALDDGARLTFCHAADAPPSVSEVVQQVSVAWVAPQRLHSATGFRLVRASTAEDPRAP